MAISSWSVFVTFVVLVVARVTNGKPPPMHTWIQREVGKHNAASTDVDMNVCQPHASFEVSEGFYKFTSPGYDGGSGTYPDNALCIWTVEGPVGSTVTLTFESFELQGSTGDRCHNDYVAAYSGRVEDNTLLSRVCGSQLPRVVRAQLNVISVVFRTDDSVVGKGFKAVIKVDSPETKRAVKPKSDVEPKMSTEVEPRIGTEIEPRAVADVTSACGSSQPGLVVGDSGVIVSPVVGGLYPNNAMCSWKIEVSEGMRVQLDFEQFAVETDASCSYDYLDIHDGPSRSSHRLQHLCGTSLPAQISSSSNVAYLLFWSDGSDQEAGFKINFSAQPLEDDSDRLCGVPAIQHRADLINRIVGGQEAVAGSWPWQVEVSGCLATGCYRCGGTIVTKNWIITAAHCVQDGATLTVIVGQHDRGNRDGVRCTVKNMIKNSLYGTPGNSNNYDMALLELEVPLRYSNRVLPACLPTVDVAPNTLCVATGWGQTEGTGSNRCLREVYVPTIANDICNQRSYYNGGIKNQMVCAGFAQGGKDTCQGDSGGPLVCEAASGQWVLHGVTSFGAGCADPEKPGVYVRVTQLISFIQEHISDVQYS